MPHVITELCVGCKDTACVDVCPVDCIHPRKDERTFAAALQLFIDPDTCIDCGACIEACPPHAIFMDCDLPAEWRHCMDTNADHYKAP